ncbi:hypothetical protein G7Y79_00024g055690 [Physcia stellaris]|nr:hypothetical protein G7Y79_00024g055690 [Physcia stellaris]
MKVYLIPASQRPPKRSSADRIFPGCPLAATALPPSLASATATPSPALALAFPCEIKLGSYFASSLVISALWSAAEKAHLVSPFAVFQRILMISFFAVVPGTSRSVQPYTDLQEAQKVESILTTRLRSQSSIPQTFFPLVKVVVSNQEGRERPEKSPIINPDHQTPPQETEMSGLEIAALGLAGVSAAAGTISAGRSVSKSSETRAGQTYTTTTERSYTKATRTSGDAAAYAGEGYVCSRSQSGGSSTAVSHNAWSSSRKGT